MHKMGFDLLSDDISAIKFNESNLPIVTAGFPRIKLGINIIENIGENPDSMNLIMFNPHKRLYNIKDFKHIERPLKAVYCIKRGDKTCIKDIDNFESLLELIKSSYCYNFFGKSEYLDNLKQSAQIVNSVQVKILEINHSLKDIPLLMQIIEKDLQRY
jgi:hypothetical protein